MTDEGKITSAADGDAMSGGNAVACADTDRKRVLWICLLCAGCILLGMLTVGGYVWHQGRAAHRERMEQVLRTEAERLLSPLLSAFGGNDTVAMQALASEAHMRTGMRVTVMALGGRVLADSHEDPEGMDNHATRPEFAQAMERGAGSAIRFSDTLQEDFLYVALAVQEEGRALGYVRASMPGRDLLVLFREEMREATLIGIIAGVGLLLLSLALGLSLVPAKAPRDARPIRWQLLFPLGAILLLLILGAGVLFQAQHHRAMQESQHELKRSIRESLFSDLALQAEGLALVGSMMARTPSVVEAIREDDAEALLRGWEATYLRLEEENGLTHLNFLNPEGLVLARLHNPVRRGDRLRHGMVEEAIRTGSRVSGVEPDVLGILTLWVVEPVLVGKDIVGYVRLGRDVEALLAEKRRQFGAEFVLSIPKAVLQRSDWETGMQVLGRLESWDLLTDHVIQYATLDPLPYPVARFIDEIPHTEASSGEEVLSNGTGSCGGRELRAGDRWWRVGAMSLHDGGGRKIACLLFMTDITQERAAYHRLLLHGSLLGGVLLTLLLLFVYTLLRRTDGRIFAQEAALRESQERLRIAYARAETEKERACQEEALVKEVLGTISDAVILTNMEGQLTFICPNVKFIFGAPDEEIRAQGTIEGVLPDFDFDIRAMQIGEEHSNIEHPILRPDGRQRHLLINVKRIEIAAGQVLYTMRDVTERHHAMDAYRRNAERLRITLQSIGDAVLVTDPEGRVTSMNPVAESLTGWGAAEAKGHPLGEVFRIVHAQTREPAFDPVAHVLRTGETVGLANHTVLLARDGTEYQIADSAAPIRHPSGAVEGVVLVFRDVTEEYARREALRESEARFRSFVENANDIVFALTPAGAFTYVSPNWVEWMGEAATIPIGRSFEPYVHPEDVHLCQEFLARVLTTGEKQGSVQYRVKHQGGGWRWHVTNGSPIRDDSGVATQFVGIARDVTEEYAQRAALRESEARLKEAHEIAGMGHWDFDHVENRLTWSETVYALFGVKPDAFQPTYEAFLTRIDPQDRVHVDHTWRESLRSQATAYSIDHRIVREDGDVRWVMEQCNTVYDAGGEPIHSAGIILDITERKQEEFFRQLSHDVLDVLTRSVEFEASIYAVLRLLRDALQCDAVGIRLEDQGDYPYFAQAGFSRDFLLKENSLIERDAMGEICRSADGSICLQCTCGLVLSGKTDPENPFFTPGGSCWTNNSFPLLEVPEEDDLRHHPRNECIHSQYASVALIPIRVATEIRGLLQLNGKKKGLFSRPAVEMLEEVAGTIGHALMRIQVEEALRASEKKYRMLSELAMEGIWVIDGEGCTTYVNPAMSAILGYSSEEMCGKPVYAFMDETSKTSCKMNMERRRLGIHEVHEFTFLHKDGTPVLARMSTSPIHGEDGSYAGALALVTDITEQRKTEVNIRQMEKMSAVGQLAGGVAHNFNNQLTGVIGYAHLLLTQLTDPKLKGFVEQLLIGARRSADLTKQMLAFARMDGGSLKQVDLHQLIHEVVSMVSHSMPSNIQIRQDLKANPAVITADGGQIQNAILNLAINARDAMPDGGEMIFETSVVELDADYCETLSYEIAPGAYIRLCVTDSGVGIAPDVLPRIFEPFFTTKEVGEGTGMGLPTVYGAIKLHKGAINVYSERGHGTTFKMYLPMSGELKLDDRYTKDPRPAPYPATLLLVDDETLVRALGEDMLTALGYAVVTREDGASGLAYFKAHWETINLVILDMVMPRMNGPAVFRNMRKINPAVKVILASGYSLNGTAMELLQEGACGFVQKPFDPNELSETLYTILQPESEGEDTAT